MARMIIRPAVPADAQAGSALLRRAITELCVADHSGDAARIAGWVANKTPPAWLDWLARDDATVYVAEHDGRIAGVGMMTASGEVLLNYVSPDVRFQGVSKAMLSRMEADAAAAGVEEMRLESTLTAHRFYLSAGYAPVGDVSKTLRKRLGGA